MKRMNTSPWGAALALITLVLSGFALGAYAGGGHGGGFFPAAGHGAHAHQHMIRLIHELDLDDSQQVRIHNVHELIAGHRAAMSSFHGEHLSAFLQRLQEGPLDNQLARQEIDRFLEELHKTAYGIADEAVELVNSFDDGQRQTLLRHLEEARGRS